jgi:DNA (cytosine-5)-methyltransferase 1
LRGRRLTLLVGGPPCQGFSTAGKWDAADKRNRLIMTMVQMCFVLQPDFLLIENVPGIGWIMNGRSFSELVSGIEQTGYSARAFVLGSEQYGVPQRRKRLFLFASRDGTQLEEPEPVFATAKSSRRRQEPLHGQNRLPPPVTVQEAIGDLPEIRSGGGSPVIRYRSSWTSSDYQCLMRGLISYEQFVLRRCKSESAYAGSRPKEGARLG